MRRHTRGIRHKDKIVFIASTLTATLALTPNQKFKFRDHLEINLRSRFGFFDSPVNTFTYIRSVDMESLFSDVMQYVTENAELAPWIIFGLLLLAGLNLPVSEDVMLLTSALIAQQRPDLVWQLFAGVFAGAYFSDLICYTLGRTLGPKLWQIKWFAKMVDREHVDRIGGFYATYGPLTLLVGRFIPFGVRNALFLTAGLSKMNFVKFAISDLIAATITCGLYFWLYFTYGEAIIEVIKQSNLIIFSVAAIGIVVFLVKRRKANQQQADETD